jgi:hypothetical protein
MLVANAPGGGYDTYARQIAPILEDQTGLRMRVVNNEAGGGSVARAIAANAGPEDLIVLVDDLTDLAVQSFDDDPNAYLAEKMDALAIIHIDPNVWILDDELSIDNPTLEPLIAAQGASSGSVGAVTLAAMSLGLETEIVYGYAGTRDFLAAVLRKEADFTAMSLTTAQRLTQDKPVHIAMVISNAPNDSVPHIPYLAGEGGLVDQRSADLSDRERAERQSYARSAIALSAAVRSISISLDAQESTRNCLRNAFEIALQTDALIENLEMLGRSVVPITGQAASSYAQEMLSVIKLSQPLITSVLETP